MARKRYKKKREDYRTGGRVQYAPRGGRVSSGQPKGRQRTDGSEEKRRLSYRR